MDLLNLTKNICHFLPPIVSQRIREFILSKNKLSIEPINFRKRAFTGGYFEGNTEDFHALRFLIHGYYDWKNVVLVKKFLEIKSGDIIEVGANIGTETVSLAKLNSENKVHAFEPVDKNFNQLKNLKKINNFQNLNLYNLLLSDKSGSTYFQLPKTMNSGTGYISKDNNDNTVALRAEKLDEKLSDIKSCSVILMDVEGFEYNILKGSKITIEKYRPFIILEANSFFLRERANVSISMLYAFLITRNYKIFFIDGVSLKEVNIQNPKTTGGKNWICIPEEEMSCLSEIYRTILFNYFNPFISYKIL